MGYWVRFKDGGVPDGYSGAHFDGAEWVEGVTAGQLDDCYRGANGDWIKRAPESAHQPTSDEIAARADSEYRAAVEAVEIARRQAYQQDADPLFFKWQAGEATEAEWREARKAVRDAFPMPERA